MAKTITEKDGVHKQWYDQASKQTLETLPAFLKSLETDYQHDYGTVCHAVAASAIAAAWAANNWAGLSGFQAGAVMWEFIRAWNKTNNKTGMRLMDYDNFLYPQYEKEYRTISKETWQAIQKEAKANIDEAEEKIEKYAVDLKQYSEDLTTFTAKYPDYFERRKHYDHLGFGTGAEWDEYKQKKESGFEFAPHEPFIPIQKDSPVYIHWQNIVDGMVPFGYFVSDK